MAAPQSAARPLGSVPAIYGSPASAARRPVPSVRPFARRLCPPECASHIWLAYNSITMNQTTVTLNVNGQQARSTLDDLRAHLKQLQAQLDQTAKSGQRVPDNLAREIKKTKAEIQRMQSATQNVADTLNRLDRATPKELNAALRTLKRQLNDCQRGTVEWAQKAAQLQRVQTEIAKINTQLRATNASQNGLKSLISATPFASLLNPLTAATAAVGAFSAAVKSSFDAYVRLDAAMAETRKYTGLTTAEVTQLNKALQRIDTRTPVEQLHLLAQEAGRLGITGEKNLLGYVRAADQINVALSDLGEGATQTIAQLGDIFKLNPDMGVEKAMLAIGSTVNVLSQNCAAAKAPIVEFTTRLAGAGQQAGLSLPQIMAFGAALDKNKLNVEASSSALQQLIQKIYQDPAKIARAAGMNIQEFTQVINKDINSGLLMFLERVRDLGSERGMAVLAPMFKDASVNGVRMTQTVSTLANEIDFLRWEQDQANKAFNEAKSVTHEYQIFNNTAAASVEKMKNAWHELGTEFGSFVAPSILAVSKALTELLRRINNPDYEIDKAVEGFSKLTDGELLVQISDYKDQIANTQAKIDSLIAAGYDDDHSTLRRQRQYLDDLNKLLAAANEAYKTRLDERNKIEAQAFKDYLDRSVPADSSAGKGKGKGKGKGGYVPADSSAGQIAAQEQALKDAYDRQLAIAQIAYTTGKTNHEQYNQAKLQAEIDYYTALAQLTARGETKTLQAQASADDARLRLQQFNAKQAADLRHQDQQQEQQDYDRLLNTLEIAYLRDELNEQAYQYAKEDALLNHLRCMVELTKEGTDERLQAEQKYALESARIEKRRQKAVQDALPQEPQVQASTADGNPQWLTDFNEQVKKAATLASIVSQSVSNLFSQIEAGITAETELAVAKLETIYDTQIRAAEGNKARTVALEQQKEKQIAAVKSEASRRAYAMQVIEAITNTISGALAAFMSAMSLPFPANLIVGPIAAAAATTAGMIQVANIKKQQAAAAAQGYAQGGYTPKGDKHKPVGIVHAGEWIAPKEMVDDPLTAPVIQQLETLRLTHRLPTTQSTTAGTPAVISSTAPMQPTISTAISTAGTTAETTAGTTALSDALETLVARLNEPFVTINTITGDHGIQRTQQLYNRLQQNKTH